MNPPLRPLRGIALLLVALLAFASFDATAKFLATRYPLPMLVWVRYTLPCLLLLAWFGPRQGRGLVATRHPGTQIVRALLLVTCTGSGMAAVRTIPLAEATAILFVAPLLVTLAAGPVLGERVPRRAWAATAIGFAGVLLIARPGTHLDAAGCALMLLAAVSFAAYQLLTRRLAATDRSLVTLFYSMSVGALVMTLGLPLYGSRIDPPALHLLLIASLGIWGMLGHFLLIRAFAHAPASSLSPFLYCQLVWATLLGWLAFGDLPDWITACGIALIAAAGLAIAMGQRQRGQPPA
ncbi:MAG TPA: DMT family transporter [Rhodocyclaceae bacterium]|nr:DMT family transporter [Rhodocyclaceae bacterium]HMV52212.1 DMT family transporter [Rhodocyclaceae bacterium]HMZ84178.1 DMT family transporter [Rhodocyclaceae bacterium]HNA02562.1 DMT family transporter [Rhodocyclaceae bacterium]HNB77219.1 DMT family transporter [Rhodocyclaceae bacterium]